MWGFVADSLTAGRLILAPVIVALGVLAGRDSVLLVLGLAMLAWLGDNLDGFLARRDPGRIPSWFGRHDFAIDVTFTWATLAYITVCGFIPIWLSLVYSLLAAVIAWRAASKPITILFVRIVDVSAGLFLLWFYPLLALVLSVFLLGLAVMQWPRLSRDSVIWARSVWTGVRTLIGHTF